MSPIERDRYTGDPGAASGSDASTGAALLSERELIDRFWGRVCVLAARRLRDPCAARILCRWTLIVAPS